MAASKVAAVTELLMARIVSGEYKDVLPPQDVLARNLCVGRPSVREAISKLEAWNVLSVRPKTGTTIKPPSEWALVNVPMVLCRCKAEGVTLDSVTIDMVIAEIRSTLIDAALKDAFTAAVA
jgi:DNA-binding FadR family transcriptional regulator